MQKNSIKTKNAQIEDNYQVLIQHAKQAMQKAYCKYSNFSVGAALLTTDGKIYTGCNVENASYGGCICGERTAFVKAISEGERSFEAIAIVTSNNDLSYPCGICRQFMAEFGLDTKIVLSNNDITQVTTLKELLPSAFTSF